MLSRMLEDSEMLYGWYAAWLSNRLGQSRATFQQARSLTHAAKAHFVVAPPQSGPISLMDASPVDCDWSEIDGDACGNNLLRGSGSCL